MDISSHLFVVKIVLFVCKDEINEKEAGNGQLFKNTNVHVYNKVPCVTQSHIVKHQGTLSSLVLIIMPDYFISFEADTKEILLLLINQRALLQNNLCKFYSRE